MPLCGTALTFFAAYGDYLKRPSPIAVPEFVAAPRKTFDIPGVTVLPFFHVTGMQGGMNSAVFSGATIVVLPPWDREAAALCMQKYRVSAWQSITAMMVDFLSNPKLGEYDLSSLAGARGGGAAMPDTIARKFKSLTGLDYVEGYGMSETIAATHINPPHRPKPQCLGIPVFDEDGYFFMTDRLKRMINASGYKVWPAEIEALMYRHPAIQEVCVIGVKDAKRGETVKALVVPAAAHAGTPGEQEVIDWAHEQMASYKAPRIVEFVTSLPKSGSGKFLWRKLQEENAARTAAVNESKRGASS